MENLNVNISRFNPMGYPMSRVGATQPNPVTHGLKINI
jgi:hypothetical protein